MKRFVSWAAVSSLPQAQKISLDDQLRVNREHVERHAGRVVEELVVPGESRSIVLFEDACRKISAYARLHELIRNRAFDVLIFLDRSRLGRTASLSMAVVELCREAGIAVYETESPPASLEPNESHDEMLLGAIKSVGAQREIVKFGERHKSGMIGRVQRGEMPGIIPYGWRAAYTRDGERVLEVDDEAASVIRTALLDLYLTQGMGLQAISDWLNERGHRTPRGKPWSVGNMKILFERLWRYAGYTEVNVRGKRNRPYVRAKGKFPPILEEDQVAALFEERQARAASRRSVTYPSRFSGVVWCDVHGKRANVHHAQPKNRPNPVSRVRCKYCVAEHMPAQISAKKIRAALRLHFLALQDRNIRAALKADDTGNARKRIQAEIRRHENGIKNAELSLLRADDAFTRRLMDSARYERQVAALNGEIETHRAGIERQKQNLIQLADQSRRGQRIDESANLGVQMLDHPDVRAANAWLRRHVRVYIVGPTIARIEQL